MDGRRFDKLKKSVARDLSPEQCIALESLVKQVASRHLCDITVARKVKAIDETRCCPRCKNTDVVKHGFDKAGRQRFRCRSMGCSKTFNALTQTPFSRMRMPEKWVAYANLMRGFMSLDEIVKTGIGITRHTAWRWRHRFLQVQSGLQSDEVKGVILQNVLQRPSWLEAKSTSRKPSATLSRRSCINRRIVGGTGAGAHGIGPVWWCRGGDS